MWSGATDPDMKPLVCLGSFEMDQDIYKRSTYCVSYYVWSCRYKMEWKQNHVIYTLNYVMFCVWHCVRGKAPLLLWCYWCLFLHVGGSWRCGDGWFTGISRTNGKRERRWDGIEERVYWSCKRTHRDWQDLFFLQTGAAWWFGIEGLPWPQRPYGYSGTPQCFLQKLEVKPQYWKHMERNTRLRNEHTYHFDSFV